MALHKLAPRSTSCVFLGYPSFHKGCRCLDLSTRRVISQHAMFDETCITFGSHPPPSYGLDFLLTSRAVLAPCNAEAVPSTVVTPSNSDVEWPRASPPTDFDYLAIILRVPVLLWPASTFAGELGHAALACYGGRSSDARSRSRCLERSAAPCCSCSLSACQQLLLLSSGHDYSSITSVGTRASTSKPALVAPAPHPRQSLHLNSLSNTSISVQVFHSYLQTFSAYH